MTTKEQCPKERCGRERSGFSYHKVLGGGTVLLPDGTIVLEEIKESQPSTAYLPRI
jgi:hypothetical protein